MLLSEIIKKSVRFLIRKKSYEILCISEEVFPEKVVGWILTTDYESECFYISSTPFELEYSDKYWDSLSYVKDYEDAVDSLGSEKLYVLSIINDLFTKK